MTIHVLNGPNLGRLGLRQPEVYGTQTYSDLVTHVENLAKGLGIEVEVLQTDSEAELIGWIHKIADLREPVILNAGGLTHTSVALRDACAELSDHEGFIEVHISNIYTREEFRHHSYLSAIAIAVIAGLGISGYEAAIRWFHTRSFHDQRSEPSEAAQKATVVKPSPQEIGGADGK